ncbi:hypothetical protein U1Q18_034005 [Sarracenia purpurea var. burkii]
MRPRAVVPLLLYSLPRSSFRLFVSVDDDPSDFLIDFKMDDKFLSDLLNTEFSPLCDADHRDNTGSSSGNSSGTLC